MYNDVTCSQGYLSSSESCSLLRDLETKHDILRVTLGKWSLWPLFRFAIATKLNGVIKHPGNRGERKNFPLAIGRCLRAARFKMDSSGRSILVSVGGYEMRSHSNQGFSSAIFGDLARCDERFFSFYVGVNDLGTDLSFPVSRYNILPSPHRLLARFRGFRNPEFWNHAVFFNAFCSKIETESGVRLGLDAYWFYKRIAQFSLSRIIYKKFFFSREQKSKQRLLLLSCSYGKEAMIAAAKECSVQVAEQQHGVIYDSHAGYAYDRQSSQRHAASMPMPDYFWSYGKPWIHAMRGTGWWSDSQIKFTGSPTVDAARESSDYERNETRKTKKIVLTTQGVYRNETVSFINLLIASNMFRSHGELTIRAHPGEESGYFECLADKLRKKGSRVKVSSSRNSNISTPQLLKASDVHVSISSTCHFEAVAVGTPSIVLPVNGSDIIRNFPGEFGLHFAKSFNDSVQAIFDVQSPPAPVGEAIYGTRSVEKMLDLTKELESVNVGQRSGE